MKLTKRVLLDMYGQMLRIRLFEQSLEQWFKQGLIAGAGHACIGEEAVAVGACRAMGEKDYLTTTHRGSGQLLARGMSMPVMLAEIFGKATGCVGGKGGSMHLCDFDKYILGTISIVGRSITMAGGVGLAIKMQKTNQVSVCFFGDGAANEGVFHEALNLASLLQVPAVFICINNQYAQEVPLRKHCANPNIAARAAAYNMPGQQVDGTDVVAVYETVKNAVERARQGDGPSLIECVCYRLRGHSLGWWSLTGAGAHPKGELEEWEATKDPIKLFRQRLLQTGYMDDDIEDKIKTRIKQELGEAFDYAMSSPEPTAESAFDGIYAQ